MGLLRLVSVPLILLCWSELLNPVLCKGGLLVKIVFFFRSNFFAFGFRGGVVHARACYD